MYPMHAVQLKIWALEVCSYPRMLRVLTTENMVSAWGNSAECPMLQLGKDTFKRISPTLQWIESEMCLQARPLIPFVQQLPSGATLPPDSHGP